MDLRISKAAALLGYDCAIVIKNRDFGDLPRKSQPFIAGVFSCLANSLGVR